MGYRAAERQLPGDGYEKGSGRLWRRAEKDYRALYGASVHMAGRGEAVARRENYCEIDPKVVDRYGIPVLRFNVSHSEYEIKQAKHMKETFSQILHAMGAVVTHGHKDGDHNNWGLHAPGNIIHEAGSVRMGNDPKTSPLNKWNQAHEVKNLFCMDGGPFVSQADKNITWTILALSMRASEHLIDEMKKIIFKYRPPWTEENRSKPFSSAASVPAYWSRPVLTRKTKSRSRKQTHRPVKKT
ncbi:GMC oxidoreductase [Puia sp. P3]|uniref:GMC oxidoreductase n=1 Tax=Puia sp. P3 TaxID=3423952 RepID=UPI003D679743